MTKKKKNQNICHEKADAAQRATAPHECTCDNRDLVNQSDFDLMLRAPDQHGCSQIFRNTEVTSSPTGDPNSIFYIRLNFNVLYSNLYKHRGHTGYTVIHISKTALNKK